MSNNIYCTYLTVYSGDKLPPLYIGSTSVNRINKGYHGSVESKKYKEIWKSELKERPDLFETQILTTHSTREEALEEEMRLQELHDVVNSELYINMAIANKKFICNSYTDPEYRNKMAEIHRSPEVRKKKSESHKGKKRKPFTKEHRENISKSRKGKTIEKMRGENNPRFGKTKELNPFYGKHHTEEHKLKHSEKMKILWSSDEYRKNRELSRKLRLKTTNNE